jgi:hypothetical protein
MDLLILNNYNDENIIVHNVYSRKKKKRKSRKRKKKLEKMRKSQKEVVREISGR